MIDVAPWYGVNGGRESESIVGKAIQPFRRQDLVISTKVGRFEPDTLRMFDFSYDRTVDSIQQSLTHMGTEYIDIGLAHDIEFAPTPQQITEETLPALDAMRQAGNVRFIGVTGYDLASLKRAVENSPVKVDVVLTYCRYTLFDQSLVAGGYLDYFRSRGIGVINAAPLGMGLLTPFGPPSWHPCDLEMREACKAAVDYCEKQQVDIGRIAIAYSYLNQGIDSTIFSTPSIDILNANIENVDSKPLTDKETAVLQYLQEVLFAGLPRRHWEGTEVGKYRRKLAAAHTNILAAAATVTAAASTPTKNDTSTTMQS
jgi:aryl-alcohol dehydrogenase-like predicted oxidoreductase